MDRFPSEAIESLRSYVYALRDPRLGRIFYIGKGSGDRAFEHAKNALHEEENLKNDTIREILASGASPEIVIIRHGLDDATAFEVEAALIDAFIDQGIANLTRGADVERGMMKAAEIVELYSAMPADIKVPAIIIKIEREWRSDLTADQLYERTRRYWRCNPERQPIPPVYAIAVARGIIREVYDIRSWEDYANMSEVKLDPQRARQIRSKADQSGQSRKGFVGVITNNLQLRAELIGKSVRHIPFGSGNPITYVNCKRLGAITAK